MKQFAPTETQIRLAEAVFTAQANEQLIRPIVESYETAILANHQWMIARKWVEKGLPAEVILDRKDAFLLSDEDAKIYYQECDAARDAAKLSVSKPGNCPLCEAEHLRIQAENALLEAMGDTPGLEVFKRGFWKLDLRKKAIDLTLRLLAPFCRSADDILGRYAQAQA